MRRLAVAADVLAALLGLLALLAMGASVFVVTAVAIVAAVLAATAIRVDRSVRRAGPARGVPHTRPLTLRQRLTSSTDESSVDAD